MIIKTLHKLHTIPYKNRYESNQFLLACIIGRCIYDNTCWEVYLIIRMFKGCHHTELLWKNCLRKVLRWRMFIKEKAVYNVYKIIRLHVTQMIWFYNNDFSLKLWHHTNCGSGCIKLFILISSVSYMCSITFESCRCIIQIKMF